MADELARYAGLREYYEEIILAMLTLGSSSCSSLGEQTVIDFIVHWF